MPTPKSPAGDQSTVSLLDSQITTGRVDRRSFLTRATGAGTLVVSSALLAACGEGDKCDSDVSTDSDAGPEADVQDTCDADR